MPSNESSARVATFTSPYASSQARPAAISETTIHSGLFQMPVLSRNDEPNSPTSAMFAAMKQLYVASSAQQAKNPARGPSVTPASA